MKNSAILKGQLVVSTEFYETELPRDSVDCPLWVVSGCVYDGKAWLKPDGSEPRADEEQEAARVIDTAQERTRLERQRNEVQSFGTGTNAERIGRLEKVLGVVWKVLNQQ
jgi:hypothetical protein